MSNYWLILALLALYSLTETQLNSMLTLGLSKLTTYEAISLLRFYSVGSFDQLCSLLTAITRLFATQETKEIIACQGLGPTDKRYNRASYLGKALTHRVSSFINTSILCSTNNYAQSLLTFNYIYACLFALAWAYYVFLYYIAPHHAKLRQILKFIKGG